MGNTTSTKDIKGESKMTIRIQKPNNDNIRKSCYHQILARKNERDKWQIFTGLIKNKTKQFMIRHYRNHFAGMDYEFALYTRKDRQSFIERIT